MPRVICIGEEFHRVLKDRIVGDQRVRRALEKRDNKKYYKTWKEATNALAPELQRLLR